MKLHVECPKTFLTLTKDVYAEQFADPGDIKTNWMVQHSNSPFDEDEDPHALAKRLRATAKKLEVMARFLERRKK